MARPTDRQRAFNIVWGHFVINKGKQSIAEDKNTGNVMWMYRGPYRRKDSIGLLITDEDYHPDMEGLSVEEVLSEWPDIQLAVKDIDLLVRLQWAHDCVAKDHKEFSEKVCARLKQVAQEFDLKT